MNYAKCIVYDCPNHQNEGQFVGDLCGPCFDAITKKDAGATNAANFIMRLPWLKEYIIQLKEDSIAQGKRQAQDEWIQKLVTSSGKEVTINIEVKDKQ